MRPQATKEATILTNTIDFWVQGTPAPKGSKRHVGGGRMIESSKKLPAWMQAVKLQAAKNRPRIPIDGPAAVRMDFYLQRPKRPLYASPAVKPDCDKLARSILDALEAAGILKNDSRVTHLEATKHYADNHNPAGAHITITWKD
ncbi:RusA family crossover junction endodeoxyribonuclease [Corynebacterium accolens]|uniref:RusA family crossover junction endodeoxyribonuclease n=1 Tax=Corynebacterium accolens TaxID=38284 RepID=UPI002542A4C5|nr:RusA family crossover junction endodeoxyribonuclease [Corynebacterium accolens]MDK4337693.1 RusA family crossover junction endodeoxyribonuclease [Corynebacterium accolens]